MAVISWASRRLLHTLVLLVGISLVSYLLLTLAPGDYYEVWKLSPFQVHRNPEAPFVVRHATWLRSALRGDWGMSLAYQTPVAALLLPRIGNTLLLTGTALMLAWGIGVPWGIWSAGRQARAAKAVTSGLAAVPELVMALGLAWIAAHARVVATTNWLWPIAVLTLGGIPTVWRHERASMVEVLAEPYAEAAKAHGIAPPRLLWRHLLPVAANPLASLFGVNFGGLLSASLIVEVIFGFPGLGPLLFEAIGARDLDVIHAAVLGSAVCFAAGSLLTDLLLYATDPRLR